VRVQLRGIVDDVAGTGLDPRLAETHKSRHANHGAVVGLGSGGVGGGAEKTMVAMVSDRHTTLEKRHVIMSFRPITHSRAPRTADSFTPVPAARAQLPAAPVTPPQFGAARDS